MKNGPEIFSGPFFFAVTSALSSAESCILM